jgi:hypothetical protein
MCAGTHFTVPEIRRPKSRAQPASAPIKIEPGLTATSLSNCKTRFLFVFQSWLEARFSHHFPISFSFMHPAVWKPDATNFGRFSAKGKSFSRNRNFARGN